MYQNLSNDLKSKEYTSYPVALSRLSMLKK